MNHLEVMKRVTRIQRAISKLQQEIYNDYIAQMSAQLNAATVEEAARFEKLKQTQAELIAKHGELTARIAGKGE